MLLFLTVWYGFNFFLRVGIGSVTTPPGSATLLLTLGFVHKADNISYFFMDLCNIRMSMDHLTLSSMGEGRCTPPTPVVSCPLLEKSSRNPYFNILDFSQLFFMWMPLWKKINKLSFIPPQSTFWTPGTKIIYIFLLLLKNLLTNPGWFFYHRNIFRFWDPHIPIG